MESNVICGGSTGSLDDAAYMSSIIDFWKKFDEEWDAKNRSTLIVQGDTSLHGDISAYKLYINRNVHRTGARFTHLAPQNSVYVRLKAGFYSVILREHDVKKPNRMESNSLNIEIQNDEQIMIQASLIEGQLILSFDEASDTNILRPTINFPG